MEGERELVLGNKQLVSFFFIVVALCGVFFALGYIVRGNSLKQAAAAVPDTTAAPLPQAQDRQPPREMESPAQAPAPAAVPPTTDIPAQGAPPDAGATYLQVAALRRADAENLVKTLREQGYPGMLEQSSKPDLFRVLVGPYRQAAEVADVKLRLKGLGFSDATVQHK